ATPPPPLPALIPGQTNRNRIESVTAGCSDCHAAAINPLGFAFEGFDGLGQVRDHDNGVAVDTMATYAFAAGARAFADGRAGRSSARPNRRAFLRGMAGATVALPFLESMPERSPWAASGPKPVFGFFMCAVGGVVRPSFFPAATGPLTRAGLAAEVKATSALS